MRKPPPKKFPNDWQSFAEAKIQQDETSRPRLRSILKGCNQRAWRHSHYSQMTAEDWTAGHEPVLDSSTLMRRSLIGSCLLLPIAIISFMALLKQVAANSDESLLLSTPVWFSLMGLIIWFVFALSKLSIFEVPFLYLYVLGHELTHALAVYACFGWVHRFSVRIDGGFIESNKNNLFVALAPYFLPLWMILFLGLLSGINYFWSIPAFEPIFFAFAGFWWGFHLYWTAWILPKEQPDLDDNGTFFSFMIVYLANLIIIGAVLYPLGLLSPLGFFEDCLLVSHATWETIIDLFKWIAS